MKRYLAILLTMAMLVGSLPVAWAEEPEEVTVVQETDVAEPEPTENTEAPEADPIEESVAEPAAEPTIPATQESAAPTEEPTAEPAAEPTAEPTPEPERVISVSVSAEPAAEDGTTEIVATVEMNFEAEVVYNWQTISAEEHEDPDAEWISLDEHEDTLKLSGLTVESCDSMLYRCVVAADGLTAASNELMLDAGRYEAIMSDSAVSEETCEFEYVSNSDEEGNEDGTCMITGYNGSAAEVIIPEKIGDLTVTDIANSAFVDRSTLTNVTIPDTVTYIGMAAFMSCGKLTDITIPGSVECIGATAFADCTGLTSVTIQTGTTKIGDYAFAGCSSLASITIPDSVTSIGDNAIPKGVKVICSEDSAAAKWVKQNIAGDYAYTEEGAITGYNGSAAEIIIPKVIDGVSITGIGNYAFANCSNLTSITIPDGVTSIGGYAFYGCNNLTCITIPDSVTSIGESAVPSAAIIICRAGSAAENYAKTNGNSTEDLAIAENLSFSLDNGAYTVTGFKGKGTEAVIPATYGGIPVTSIGDGAFSGCGNLTSVTIPDGVTSIGDSAFEYCDNLKDISIPENVTSIGSHAFDGCISLTSISVPAGVTRIGYGTFEGCSALERVVIPDTVTSIDYAAFRDCDTLTGIAIPESVTSIGNAAFSGCDSLSSITIPAGVTSIGEYTFSDCGALTEVTIAYGVKGIGNYAFEDCSALTNISMPSSVTSIGSYAFENCGALKDVTIPDGVTSIGEYAFSGCNSLASITIPDSVTSIGYRAIPKGTTVNCSVDSAAAKWVKQNLTGDYSYTDEGIITGYTGNDTTIVIPEKIDGITITGIGDSAFSCCHELKSVTIQSNITSIGASAFCDCLSLVSITIPGSVEAIDNSTFEGCGSLSAIIIPDGVTNIGFRAFKDCDALTSIDLPDSLTSIDEKAFENCTRLTNIELPAKVTSIGYEAFSNCGKLTGVTIPSGVSEIEDETFYGCSSLESITIPDGVTSIGYNAFSGCSSLTNINIPDSVTSIGSSAFSGCSSLESIAIPSSVKEINSSTFENCVNLTVVTLPEGMTGIGRCAFADCKRLTDIVIPGTVTSIGDDVFGGSGITSITIPDSVTELGVRFVDPDVDIVGESAAVKQWLSDRAKDDGFIIGLYEDKDGCYIEEYIGTATEVVIPSSINGQPVTMLESRAFANCRYITSVEIPDSVTETLDGVFSGCTALKTVIIPNSLTVITADMFAGCTGLESLTIPSSVTYIQPDAFRDCSALKSIVLPEGVEGIGECAFEGCSALTSVTLPDTLESIIGSAFKGCVSLKSIYIPSTVTKINDWCETEEDTTAIPPYITIICAAGSEAERYALEHGNPIEYVAAATDFEYALNDDGESYTITGYKGDATDLIIPAKHDGKPVTAIGGAAFYKNTSLTSAVIPTGVTKIDASTFYGCTSLTSIVIPNGLTEIGGYAFADCSSLTSVEIPDSVTTIYGEAFNGCKGLTNVRLSSGVTFIQAKTFANCSSLTSVVIPDGVEIIGVDAFANCSSLTNITIPDSVTTINAGAIPATAMIICNEGTAAAAYAKELKQQNCTHVWQDSVCTLCGKVCEHEWEKGTCENCGLVCTHPAEQCGECWEYLDYDALEYVDEGDYHTVKSTVEKTLLCFVCYEKIKTGEQKQVTEHYLHSYEDGSLTCSDCGHTKLESCTHENMVYSISSEEDSYSYVDAATHTVTLKNTKCYNCWECGYTAEEAMPDTQKVAYHTYDETSGKCVCGAEKPECEHANTIEVTDYRYEYDNGCYDNGDGTHTPCGIGNVCTYCTDCGALLNEKRTNDAIVAPHDFAGGNICLGCNARRTATGEAVTAISLNPSRVSLEIGESFEMKASLTPENAENKNLWWRSSNAAIATVKDGVITAVSAGTTTIDCIAMDGNGATASCVVTVEQAADFSYELSEDGESYMLLSYNGNAAKVEIPSMRNGKPVTTIGIDVFMGNETITDVTIPSTVTTIRSQAFLDCTNLKNITIPDSVINFEYDCMDASVNVICSENSVAAQWVKLSSATDYKFVAEDGAWVCSGYKGSDVDVVIPGSVNGVAINEIRGFGSRDLTSVTVGNGIKVIGEGAFAGNDNLSSLVIPSSVTTIGQAAVDGCYALKQLAIPDSIVNFEEGAIPSDITIICNVGSAAETWVKKNGNPYICKGKTDDFGYELTKDGCTITSYTGTASAVAIPSTIAETAVTAIGSGAFTGVKSATLPDTISNVASGAFPVDAELYCALDSTTAHTLSKAGYTFWQGDCEYCYIYNVPQEAMIALTAMDDIAVIDETPTVSASGLALLRCKPTATAVKVPETVTIIAQEAFKDCTQLTSIELPSSVTEIDEAAFDGCTSLTSVAIPENVESIGDSAFNGCTSLENVTISSEKVESIGDSVFSGCEKLESITIPDSVTEIGDSAFNGCASLESVTIPDSVTSIGKSAFNDCEKLKNISIPDSVTNIGEDAIPSDTTILCNPDTVAGKYAEKNENATKNLTQETCTHAWQNGVCSLCGKPCEHTWDGNGCEICGYVPLTALKLNFSKLYLGKNQKVATLKAIVEPANATEQAITWTSSNTKVATVSENGEITCVASKGSAVITATVGTFTASCTVYAKAKGAMGIKLAETANVTLNKSITLKASVSGKPTVSTVIWTSSDSEVATVSSKGVVKGLKLGTAVITATASSGYQAKCTVTVENQKVTSIKLSKTKTTLLQNNRTTLKATISPKDAFVKDVSWASSNENVATVDASGVVTAIGAGKAVITCTANDGSLKSAKCEVTVKRNPVTKVTMTYNGKAVQKLTFKVEDTRDKEYTFVGTAYPATASDTGVKYSSSNTKVVTIDENTGVFKVVGAGKATVTCASVSDKNVKASCVINVTKVAVTKIKLYYYDSLVTSAGLTFNYEKVKNQVNKGFKATVLPTNATYKDIWWKSSDKKVVTIDRETGAFTIVGTGTATIKCFSNDNGAVYGRCVITVKKTAVKSISVTHNGAAVTSKTVLKMAKGDKDEGLKVSFNPTDATNQALSWKSSDKKIVTVDGNGALTAKAKGTATITVTSKDNSKIKLSFKVKVK